MLNRRGRYFRNNPINNYINNNYNNHQNNNNTYNHQYYYNNKNNEYNHFQNNYNKNTNYYSKSNHNRINNNDYNNNKNIDKNKINVNSDNKLYNNDNIYNYNNDNNIIEKLNIIETNFKSSDYIQNKEYGYEFEQSISLKSCLFLPISSIKEDKIFTKEYRYFYGLKLIIINENKPEETASLLDEGKFKIIPFSNNYYQINLDGLKKYFISYNDEDIFVKTDINFVNLNKNKTYSNYHTKTKTSKKDTYVGTFNLFFNNNKKSKYQISLYSTKCEIDGLFESLDNIKLSSFGINEIYSNYSDKIIEKNSLIVYEIKSGKKEKKLINQMMKRCFFIQKYLNNIYDKQIYYIGFFRAKKYNDKKESFEEEKENKDKIDDKQTLFEDKMQFTENTNDDIKKTEVNIKKDENIDTIINQIKKNEGGKVNNINEEETNYKSDKSDNQEINNIISYSQLNNFPTKITIFQIKDSIFGENLIYDQEHLNLLRNLRNKIDNIEIRMNNVEKDVKDIKTKMDKMDDDAQDMKKNILKIMEALNIKK